MLESTEHMPKEGLRRLLQAAALSGLALLGLALGTDAFVHTDDGCVVETHCVACVCTTAPSWCRRRRRPSSRLPPPRSVPSPASRPRLRRTPPLARLRRAALLPPSQPPSPKASGVPTWCPPRPDRRIPCRAASGSEPSAHSARPTSAVARIPPSRLLKSWATPLASWPTLSSFWLTSASFLRTLNLGDIDARTDVAGETAVRCEAGNPVVQDPSVLSVCPA